MEEKKKTMHQRTDTKKIDEINFSKDMNKSESEKDKKKFHRQASCEEERFGSRKRKKKTVRIETN